ncbi:MAG TPA: sigma-70 family RNA polymerase sigma factor [Verrucomicrobiae bacterium]|nr:sigma-70 family RNA polymerase sigma factor [Verrucomicrobiae bacterium]
MSSVPQPISDEELARQTRAGSLESFEELVARYQGRIYRFVRNFCRAETDTREITQDTFVRAYQAIAQFDPRQSFAGWLFAIARHKCIDHYRAAKPVSNAALPEQHDDNDPAAQLARREDSENLWRVARRHLSEVQFQALWLKYVDELEVADIARALGKTRTHVKVLLFRSRQILAAKLRGSTPAEPVQPPPVSDPLKTSRITPMQPTG